MASFPRELDRCRYGMNARGGMRVATVGVLAD
jgi:hypothetical protein